MLSLLACSPENIMSGIRSMGSMAVANLGLVKADPATRPSELPQRLCKISTTRKMKKYPAFFVLSPTAKYVIRLQTIGVRNRNGSSMSVLPVK